MKSIFIADAHLISPEDANYRMLLRFLDELAGKIDTLFIMGDLFDFWLGFPSNPFTQYDAILDALERLVANGCKLVYFEGNHDFHLGAIFSHRLKAEIHTGPIIKTVQGKRLYLCHGDQINREDNYYRLLRFVLRSSPAVASLRYLQPSWAESIRAHLQKESKTGYKSKTNRWNYRRIIFDFARSLINDDCEGLITGHFHLAIEEEIPTTSFTVISLGDWIDQFTYAEMLDGNLQLKSYSPNIIV